MYWQISHRLVYALAIFAMIVALALRAPRNESAVPRLFVARQRVGSALLPPSILPMARTRSPDDGAFWADLRRILIRIVFSVHDPHVQAA